jgi:hypothetical protein
MHMLVAHVRTNKNIRLTRYFEGLVEAEYVETVTAVTAEYHVLLFRLYVCMYVYVYVCIMAEYHVLLFRLYVCMYVYVYAQTCALTHSQASLSSSAV